MNPIEHSPGPVFLTGATGLLGSHIAEALVRAGLTVRALARPASDTSFLRDLGIESITGDLGEPTSYREALQGVDRVFHSASKVGDWGTWDEFARDCIRATQRLGQEAAEAGVGRFLHISSTSAYGHPREGTRAVLESDPLGQNLWFPWDYYTRSKVEQERVLWALQEKEGLRLTVIRPSWLYGERDRTTTARLINRLRERGISLVGPGDNPLSSIYAGEVADAALLAAYNPAAQGQAYNITDQGFITQREFLELWAKECHAPPQRQTFNYWALWAAAFGLECWGRLSRSRQSPLITRYATWLLGRDLRYSTDKARRELSWAPKLSYQESIERTARWYLSHQAGTKSA